MYFKTWIFQPSSKWYFNFKMVTVLFRFKYANDRPSKFYETVQNYKTSAKEFQSFVTYVNFRKTMAKIVKMNKTKKKNTKGFCWNFHIV